MISVDIPNQTKQYSDCSIRVGGPKIDDNSIRNWINTSTNDEAKDIKRAISMLNMMLGGAETITPRVPLKKDINLAPDNENTLRMVLSQFNFDKKLGKDWCNQLIKEIN